MGLVMGTSRSLLTHPYCERASKCKLSIGAVIAKHIKGTFPNVSTSYSNVSSTTPTSTWENGACLCCYSKKKRKVSASNDIINQLVGNAYSQLVKIARCTPMRSSEALIVLYIFTTKHRNALFSHMFMLGWCWR
jgi:hypothetical protein